MMGDGQHGMDPERQHQFQGPSLQCLLTSVALGARPVCREQIQLELLITRTWILPHCQPRKDLESVLLLNIFRLSPFALVR